MGGGAQPVLTEATESRIVGAKEKKRERKWERSIAQ